MGVGGALALAAFAATGVGGVLTADEMEITSSPESVRGEQLLGERLRGPEPDTETVIVRSTAHTIDSPEFQAQVNALTAALLSRPDVVASAVNFYQAKATGSPTAEALVLARRHTTLIPRPMAAAGTSEKSNSTSFAAILVRSRRRLRGAVIGAERGRTFMDT